MSIDNDLEDDYIFLCNEIDEQESLVQQLADECIVLEGEVDEARARFNEYDNLYDKELENLENMRSALDAMV